MRWPTLLLLTMASATPYLPALDIQGHRGAAWVLPENTLAGFAHAIVVGADTLELDLGVTRDLEVVVSHDPRIHPDLCLDPDGERIKDAPRLHDLTLAEIHAYDCGALQSPRFPEQTPVPGQRIPTLHEVFELVAASGHPNAQTLRFNIETKIRESHPEETPPPEVFAELVYHVVRKHGMLARTTLQSFDFRTLRAAKELDPTWEIAALIPVQDGPERLLEVAESLQPEIISPDYRLLDAELVQTLQEKGVRVIPWTVNDEADWDRLVEWGVDGIITDRPGDLVRRVRGR